MSDESKGFTERVLDEFRKSADANGIVREIDGTDAFVGRLKIDGNIVTVKVVSPNVGTVEYRGTDVYDALEAWHKVVGRFRVADTDDMLAGAWQFAQFAAVRE